MNHKVKVFFNNVEVEEVLFEYVRRDLNAQVPFLQRAEYEKQFGCALKFHTDLDTRSSNEMKRLIKLRKPTWRGVKTIHFYTDQHTFRYEGLDKNGKHIVTIMFPMIQINYLQAHSRQTRIKRVTKYDPLISQLYLSEAERLR